MNYKTLVQVVVGISSIVFLWALDAAIRSYEDQPVVVTQEAVVQRLIEAHYRTVNEEIVNDETAPSLHAVGETVSSSRFAVTLHGFEFVNGLEINMFSRLEPIENSFYIILDTTWENIGNESSSISTPGNILFAWEGENFLIDSPEIVWAEGWGFFERIAPFQKHRTRIVFSVPYKPGMRIAWTPVRDRFFFLEELNTQPL